MEVTDVHILRLNKSKILTINLHHVLSTVTMDDLEVFADFMKNTLRVTTHQNIYVITNFVEYFGRLLAVNDGYIGTFSRISILRIIPERLRREY